jgi:drug/metabolite transporter (DMT)-like permease
METKQMKKSIDPALLAFIAVCIIWGSTYLAIRIGVTYMPPLLFAGIRFIISGTIMFGYVYFRKLEWPKDPKEWRKQAIVGLFLLLGGNGFVVFASQWVTSGSTSILIATTPLFMALIEYFIPNRPRLDLVGWIGLMIGFLGVIYLIFGKQQVTGIDPLGGGLILLASLCWAAGSVYSKSFKTTGSIYAGIGIQMLAGGTGQILTGLLTGEAARFTLHPSGLLAMLYLIVFGSIIGYSSYIYVLQKWPAAKAGTYAYVNPLVAVFLGFMILQEPFTITILISGAIILVGVYLVQRAKYQKV